METLNCQITSPVDVMSANNFMVAPVQSMPRKTASKGSKAGTKKTNSKQNGKDGDKPKRPLSAYNLFFQYERAEILKSTPSKYEGNKPRRSHGKIGFASLARQVAASWNNIDPENRKRFDEAAAADKARYKKEMEVWKTAQTLKQNKNDLSFSSPASISMPHAFNAQSIVKCNMMAASQASQNSGRMVFTKFQNPSCATPLAPVVTPSARFFFQNLNQAHSNANMRVGKASAVVGQALALLEEDSMPTFQPLDDTTLETVESEDTSLNSSNHSTGGRGERRGSGSSPHISELAAKLDDDCLGFMSGLLF